MRSYFHVALHEVVRRSGKYGDRVETVPTCRGRKSWRLALRGDGQFFEALFDKGGVLDARELRVETVGRE